MSLYLYFVLCGATTVREEPVRGGGMPGGDNDKLTQDVGSRAPPANLLSSFGEGAQPACIYLLSIPPAHSGVLPLHN